MDAFGVPGALAYLVFHLGALGSVRCVDTCRLKAMLSYNNVFVSTCINVLMHKYIYIYAFVFIYWFKNLLNIIN